MNERRSQLSGELIIFLRKEGRNKPHEKNTLEVKQKINCKYNQKQRLCMCACLFYLLAVRKRNSTCAIQRSGRHKRT